jgi:hypothetical protein
MDCLPQIHTVAIHAEAGYNTVVPGLGILCAKDDYFAGAGVYKNSISKTSVYAQAGMYLLNTPYVKFGFLAGVVTGYPLHPVIPMGGGVVTVGTGGTRAVHLLLVPKVSNVAPAFVQLSYTFKL